MKINGLFFVAFIIVFLFISSCTKDKKGIDEDLEFKKMCIDAGYDEDEAYSRW